MKPVVFSVEIKPKFTRILVLCYAAKMVLIIWICFLGLSSLLFSQSQIKCAVPKLKQFAQLSYTAINNSYR